MQLFKWALPVGAVMVMACAQAGSPQVLGQWGGDHVRLTLDASGGRIEYDCGAGTIDSVVQLDAGSRFSVKGKHEEFTAARGAGSGPTDADASPVMQSANYSGKVDGDHMALSVLIGSEKTPRSFTLVRGKSVKLIRCL
jgi:hypothetical protein